MLYDRVCGPPHPGEEPEQKRKAVTDTMTTLLSIILGSLLLPALPASGSSALPASDALSRGFTPVEMVTEKSFSKARVPAKGRQAKIDLFCKRLGTHFKKYKWSAKPCGKVPWKTGLQSKAGHPLLYVEFGRGKETTLLMSGVHPDELTPIPIGFRFARYLLDHPESFDPEKFRVIVAPLVNPDGFIRNIPSRTNGNGVDVNRNFYTKDWYAKAIKRWSAARSRNPRHFPGYFPNSEVETVFQMRLIEDYNPQKIISIHAPLGFLDYDGPGDRKRKSLSMTEKKAKHLAHAIAEKSRNYRVVDYSFYPGSLGNFAGNERRIPTITLELMTTEPKKHNVYWEHFLPGLIQSVRYPLKKWSARTSGVQTRFTSRYPRSDRRPTRNL